MVTKKVKVKNEQGLHMRPANMLVKEAVKYNCEIYFTYNGTKISATSIMNIIAACIKKDAELEISCDGLDENQALENISKLFDIGFNE